MKTLPEVQIKVECLNVEAKTAIARVLTGIFSHAGFEVKFKDSGVTKDFPPLAEVIEQLVDQKVKLSIISSAPREDMYTVKKTSFPPNGIPLGVADVIQAQHFGQAEAHLDEIEDDGMVEIPVDMAMPANGNPVPAPVEVPVGWNAPFNVFHG
jgi:hypothetical protein